MTAIRHLINVLLNDRHPPTANRQPPTANHDEKNYIILGFFSTKVEPLRLSPNMALDGTVQ
jgi:hypothetical protein